LKIQDNSFTPDKVLNSLQLYMYHLLRHHKHLQAVKNRPFSPTLYIAPFETQATPVFGPKI